jgi:hypothetical protein
MPLLTLDITWYGVALPTGFSIRYKFIDHLYTQLGTTSNYSAIANIRTLQITTDTLSLSSLLCL